MHVTTFLFVCVAAGVRVKRPLAGAAGDSIMHVTTCLFVRVAAGVRVKRPLAGGWAW